MYFLVWISWTVIVVLFFKGIIQSSFAQQNLALANIDNIVIIIINFIIIIAILIINATINTMTIKLFLNLKKKMKNIKFSKKSSFSKKFKKFNKKWNCWFGFFAAINRYLFLFNSIFILVYLDILSYNGRLFGITRRAGRGPPGPPMDMSWDLKNGASHFCSSKTVYLVALSWKNRHSKWKIMGFMALSKFGKFSLH